MVGPNPSRTVQRNWVAREVLEWIAAISVVVGNCQLLLASVDNVSLSDPQPGDTLPVNIYKQTKKFLEAAPYLPAFVMIISVPTSWNFSHNSRSCKNTLMPSMPCSRSGEETESIVESDKKQTLLEMGGGELSLALHPLSYKY